jgi:hypothetical protein
LAANRAANHSDLRFGIRSLPSSASSASPNLLLQSADLLFGPDSEKPVNDQWIVVMVVENRFPFSEGLVAPHPTGFLANAFHPASTFNGSISLSSAG